jgi:hypothetical protein
MEIFLIFIGNDFYFESGTMMSCIYTEDGNRYDWGFVQRDLSEGKTVTIRSATDAELGFYYKKLQEYKDKK